MICKYFQPSSECSECEDKRCALKGGTVSPSEMCGCDCCDLQHMVGDKEECMRERCESDG